MSTIEEDTATRAELIAMKAVVRDVMSTHPVSVRKAAPVKEVATLLHADRVSAFPVLDDDGTVVGGVSEAVGHEVLNQVRRVQGVVAVRDRLVYPPAATPAAPGPYF